MEQLGATTADAVVFAGMGMGNMHPDYVPVVAELRGRGIPVVVASRVDEGPVIPTYGNGGAAELVENGVLMSSLNPFHTRILLSAAVAAGYSHDQLKSLFEN